MKTLLTLRLSYICIKRLYYRIFCIAVQSGHHFTRELIHRLGSCQHRFLRYLSFKTNNPMSRFEHYFTEMALHFKLQIIESLHYFHDYSLMFKILHNSFSCHSLYNLFHSRHFTYSLRSHRPIHESTCKSNFGFFSTVNILKRSWNLLPSRLYILLNQHSAPLLHDCNYTRSINARFARCVMGQSNFTCPFQINQSQSVEVTISSPSLFCIGWEKSLEL